MKMMNLTRLTCLLGIVFSCMACDYQPRGIPRGEVSGTVTFEGQPVPEGIVTFSSEKTGIAAPATLNDKGEFTIPKGIEVGEYQVTITPPDPEDVAGAPPVKSTPKDYSNIPQAYRSLTTSELRATVERGDNSFEFEMKKQQ